MHLLSPEMQSKLQVQHSNGRRYCSMWGLLSGSTEFESNFIRMLESLWPFDCPSVNQFHCLLNGTNTTYFIR